MKAAHDIVEDAHVSIIESRRAESVKQMALGRFNEIDHHSICALRPTHPRIPVSRILEQEDLTGAVVGSHALDQYAAFDF